MQVRIEPSAPTGPAAKSAPLPPATVSLQAAIDAFEPGAVDADWMERVARAAGVPAPATPEERFSVRRALGHIARGFKDSFKGIVRTMKERPGMCAGLLGALVGATLLWPSVMAIVIPGIQVVTSSIKAGRGIYRALKAPDARSAEAALADVGDGIAGMALLGAGMAFGRVVRAFRNAGLVHLVDDAPPLLQLVGNLFKRKQPDTLDIVKKRTRVVDETR